jgi:hypothetical protein
MSDEFDDEPRRRGRPSGTNDRWLEAFLAFARDAKLTPTDLVKMGHAKTTAYRAYQKAMKWRREKRK